MQKLVSVGVAVYNGEKTIRRCLQSLLKQTYNKFEIIIIDDFSNDNSVSICEEFAIKDKRVRFYKNNKNKGMINNFNELFKISKGTYFFWADQDDLRDKKFIEKSLNLLEKNSSSVLCHCETKVFFQDPTNIFHINYMHEVSKQTEVYERYKSLLWYYNDTNIYGLIRSSALKKTNLWKKINGSSNNLLFELCLIGKFEYISEPLFIYSGKEITKRPSIREEYEISTKSKAPRIYSAGIILLFSQLQSIIKSNINFKSKILIIFYLLSHFVLINFSKLIFRIFFNKKTNSIPNLIYKFCLILYPKNKEVKILVDEKKYPAYFPKYYGFLKLK